MQFGLLLTILPTVILAAPIVTPRAGTVIPGKYIVKFKDAEVSTAAVESAINLLSESPEHVYSIGKFRGFAGKISDAALKDIQALPNVSDRLSLDYKISN